MFAFSKLLSVALLAFHGTQYITSTSIFVSHYGDDRDDCGSWTTKCLTVRHAVKMSKDGDQIYIDYARGKPYLECKNFTKSTCSIELTNSLSFHGLNGRPELRCWKGCTFFVLTSPDSNKTRISFFDLIISNSNVVTALHKGPMMELRLHNTLIKDNNYAIYGKYSVECSIFIINSSLEKNDNWGIYLRCHNLTVQISSCTFQLTPVSLTNAAITRSMQRTEILIRDTLFTGNFRQRCAPLLMIQPFAFMLNVTITDSQFKNYFATCKINRKSGLYIRDQKSIPRGMTFVFLSNLLIENIHTEWPVVFLTVGYLAYTDVNVMIRDSTFRNNSMVLRVSINSFKKYSPGYDKGIIFQENNTFVDNVFNWPRPYGAAAIYFASGSHRVLSCRFLDNGVTENSYTGVVKIFKLAAVRFFNTYFENRQTKILSNQLFATGNKQISFYGENIFNLIALKERQTVFIRTPTTMSSGVIISKNFKILCPQGYRLNAQRQCVRLKKRILCYYINVQCEQCPPKTYTLDRGSFILNKSKGLQCQPCPRGGDCGSGLVKAKSNFWGYEAKKKVFFIRCPPGYCCDSNDCLGYDSCDGDRVGILCGQCPEGMSDSLFSTQCVSNQKCFLNPLFVLGIFTIIVLYLVFFLYHKEIVSILFKTFFSKRLSLFINANNASTSRHTSTTSPSGMIKIFFYYYQGCNLLRSSVGFSNKSQITQGFENAISRVMNIVLINIPSFDCPFPNLRPVSKIIILHSLGYSLLILLCLVYLLSKLFMTLKRMTNTANSTVTLQHDTSTRSSSFNASTFSLRVASAFTYISLLMYAASTELCLSLLRCVPKHDKQILFLDGNVECFQALQYFFLAYMISSVLPFCLVPVLGSYLLKSGRIGVKQFFAACIIPLPFCCFWLHLLFKQCGYRNREQTCSTADESDNSIISEQVYDANLSQLGSEDSTLLPDKTTSEGTETAILGVLLGPFRPHQAFLCFPSAHIPWEGFLILRRLILIAVLTFIYDIQLRLFVASTLCVIILIIHMFVYPFQRKSDNVLESFSLAAHVILGCLTLLKTLYYGEKNFSAMKGFTLLNGIENFLIFAPLSIILIVLIVSIAEKVLFGIKRSVSIVSRLVIRVFRFSD